MEKNISSFITSFYDEEDLIKKLEKIENNFHKTKKIEIDGKIINNKEKLLKLIYEYLEINSDFGMNFDALFDVLINFENNYVFIIRNIDDLLKDEFENESLNIFKAILFDLIKFEGFYIFFD